MKKRAALFCTALIQEKFSQPHMKEAYVITGTTVDSYNFEKASYGIPPNVFVLAINIPKALLADSATVLAEIE
ncbi:hypothetical protein DPMN_009948 [Dreissena polymorpha]|uniref:Uncharacterized protein n=1 Tax=Dreissena polymorpha TaxID=45954 RepID=A0A9D4N0L1_DREPO|nr:hypothetical protein DPMN_009948 [Dreissena polymorpha]